MQHRKFDYTDKQDFLGDAGKLPEPLPFSDSISPLASPLEIDGKKIANRILVQPIEGFDSEPDGSPSERSLRRYLQFTDGGAAALWIESISVNNEGRSNPYQLMLTDANTGAFARFAEQLHSRRKDTPEYLIAQLTHSGRYSAPDGVPAPVCAFENPLIPRENARIITDDELSRLMEDYITAAVNAERAGFDAVDIRACHGYLLNELFAAFERGGKYGGSFENRVRLLLDVVDGVRAKTKLTVGVRLNMYDGLPYPYGWGCDKNDAKKQELSEPLRLVRLLAEHGVTLLNISSGVGAYSPFVIRPYDLGGPIPDEHPLEGVLRLLSDAREAKKAAPDCAVVCSGLTWLRQFAPNVAAGGIEQGWFDLAGFGRQALACPDFANAILSGEEPKLYCSTCCGCTTLIKKSKKQLRCVRRPEEV